VEELHISHDNYFEWRDYGDVHLELLDVIFHPYRYKAQFLSTRAQYIPHKYLILNATITSRYSGTIIFDIFFYEMSSNT